MSHQKGPITSTFTADWFLREGQGRELLGEWMKLTSVRSQDQRRMIRVNSHTFPTNVWIHKIMKGKESDRCDLCRSLWITEVRFRTEKELHSVKNLGTYPTHLRSLINSTHRCSPPMLATDSWEISTASGSRMEVFVCLRRKMLPDYMG